MNLANSARIDNVGEAAESLGQLAHGGTPQNNPVYARLHNDTVAEFEQAIADLEGTDGAVAFSSGMAAITAVMLAASQTGDNVVAVRPLYGGTDHLLADELTGLDVRWATPETVGDVVGPKTAMVIAESPANPTMDLVDIERMVRDVGDVPVVIDSTFATPMLQNPAELGAELVLHSASKYIGGHGDVIGGVVAANKEWAQRLRKIRVATGSLLHPMAAYLLRRGLATLPIRIETAQKNAIELAGRLVEHPAVEKVYYPGLPECDPEVIVFRQMRGPGAMLSFDVADESMGQVVMESVDVITPAVSLGSTDSLIQHPASLTHQVVCPEALEESGITARLLRLSVGLEHIEDLWRDLDFALRRASRLHERSRGTVIH